MPANQLVLAKVGVEVRADGMTKITPCETFSETRIIFRSLTPCRTCKKDSRFP